MVGLSAVCHALGLFVRRLKVVDLDVFASGDFALGRWKVGFRAGGLEVFFGSSLAYVLDVLDFQQESVHLLVGGRLHEFVPGLPAGVGSHLPELPADCAIMNVVSETREKKEKHCSACKSAESVHKDRAEHVLGLPFFLSGDEDDDCEVDDEDELEEDELDVVGVVEERFLPNQNDDRREPGKDDEHARSSPIAEHLGTTCRATSVRVAISSMLGGTSFARLQMGWDLVKFWMLGLMQTAEQVSESG